MRINLFRKTVLLFFFLKSFTANSQCAMCRAAVESEGSGVQAQAINDGIVYLMAIPYVLAAIVGFAIYKLKFAKKD